MSAASRGAAAPPPHPALSPRGRGGSRAFCSNCSRTLDAGPGRLIALVQARHSSARLPGKVLRPLLGQPLLGHLLARLRSLTGLDGIVVTTSTLPDDDAVAKFAFDVGAECWRGPLDDVLGRMAAAASAHRADAVLRVSGDSPLLDPRLVERAIALFHDGSAEIVTNVFPRSFPKGQSVEILSRAALERLADEAAEPADREHVTRFAYAHPDRFAIVSFAAERPRPELQLAVDTAEDLDRAAALLAAAGEGSWPEVERLTALSDRLAVGDPAQ